MKTALVTGGLGFIGSHLVEELESRGYYVVIVDNLQSNVVKPFGPFERFQRHITSIQNFNFSTTFDILFHLASPVGPVSVLKYPGRMAEMIVNDTAKVRDICLKREVPFIFVSTSEVYGHSGELHEEADKMFPGKYTIRVEYGAGKMLAEVSLVNTAKAHPNFKYKIIRPFNVSGPRQSPTGGFVIPRFIQQALSNSPLTVYGDGMQKRAFTDVRDIVDAITYITDTQEWNTIWNLGNPANARTIKQLANDILDILHSVGVNTKSKIEYVDPKLLHGEWFDEVPEKLPHVEKLYSTGWRPKYVFEDTVIDALGDIMENGVR